MIEIIISMILGTLVGYKFKWFSKNKETIEKMYTSLIILLIFSMGISIGMNKTVISSIESWFAIFLTRNFFNKW